MIREAPAEGESRERRLKRLRMRSTRRGIREMDVILSRYARTRLDNLDDAALLSYDRLLGESDGDLYRWISGQAPPPPEFRDPVRDISAHLPGGAG